MCDSEIVRIKIFCLLQRFLDYTSMLLKFSVFTSSFEGQNGSTLAVIAPTGVNNTGTYFVHYNLIGNVKQEASSQGTSISSADGVTVSR